MSADMNQGVPAEAGEGSAALASPSNEPSATETLTGTNTAAEATPGVQDTTQQGEGQPADATQPVELSEQEISILPPKAGQAFARFRTENRNLGEENTALKNQLSELQTGTPAIAIDAPVEDWKGLDQFNRLPEPYREKLGNDIGWQRLPQLLDKAIQNVETLSPAWQAAIVDPLIKSLGAEFGMTPAQVIQTLQNASGQASEPAQSSRSPFEVSQQLIAAGYEANDPLVLAARQQEQGLTQAQRQIQGFEKRIGDFETQNKAQTQAQIEAAERQRDAEFETQQKATWETILGPTLQTIPQGYEGYKRVVTLDAKDAVGSDTVAQGHLTNAKNALTQAHKYRTQGTPELAEQAMSKHGREMTAYAARCAVLTQQALKPYSDLIDENVRLKKGAIDQQQQRRDLLGGGGNGANGNGLEPRRRDPQTGQWLESTDEFVERAATWRRARTAELDAQR